MKKTFLINNRQSGKSKIALYEFLKEPLNTMLIFHNMGQYKNIQISKEYKKNFYTQNSNFMGLSFKKCIIDEYLFFDTINIKNLYKDLSAIGIEELIILTTSNKLYKSDLFYFIKFCKRNNIQNYEEEFFLKNDTEEILKDKNNITKELDELYFNFLTDEDTIIINNIELFNKNMVVNNFYITGSDKYSTEIEGKFLK
jgi:hypothetical protein